MHTTSVSDSAKCKKETKFETYALIPEQTLSHWVGLGVCHQPDVKLSEIRTVFGVSHVSSHTEEFWCNETVICGAFNKFIDFFVQKFKNVVDSWKFRMLLLHILWDDWPIFMISRSNEQL